MRMPDSSGAIHETSHVRNESELLNQAAFITALRPCQHDSTNRPTRLTQTFPHMTYSLVQHMTCPHVTCPTDDLSTLLLLSENVL
jgi:hypothetical protein